ncbi:MAG: radical SAM protein [Planctomycetes bacterium]|nr:radical SAM protein [Planctomycetota bacterium]
MTKRDHQQLTQQYSTWGDKLLQHTDVLHAIQNERTFRPITVQLAPCEVCDSDCPFCSVAARPLHSYMPFAAIQQALRDLRALGAKSLELTGGGNPLLYRDRKSGETLNDVIRFAAGLGYEIGVITNSHDLKKLDRSVHALLKWVRVSLIQLDEGREPEDYDFHGFPEERLGFSYIIYDGTDASPRKRRPSAGTTVQSIERMVRLVDLHPKVKFVRIAGNCLIKGNNKAVADKWREVIETLDAHGKMFLKDIGDDDSPFAGGCYVGAIRPYLAASPTGDGSYHVYTCTSHVLQQRTYDLRHSLGTTDQIPAIWARMSESYRLFGFPYQIDGNGGCGWDATCKFCFYRFNNQILHTVAHEMPDKNFA